jgi:hypothetical protein
MSGCAVCVNDLYADALSTYKDALTSLRSSLVSAGIPEAEWPARVQNKKIATGPARVENVALSAFEEMERALAAKKAAAEATS